MQKYVLLFLLFLNSIWYTLLKLKVCNGIDIKEKIFYWIYIIKINKYKNITTWALAIFSDLKGKDGHGIKR